jgi:hypothetical protein
MALPVLLLKLPLAAALAWCGWTALSRQLQLSLRRRLTDEGEFPLIPLRRTQL